MIFCHSGSLPPALSSFRVLFRRRLNDRLPRHGLQRLDAKSSHRPRQDPSRPRSRRGWQAKSRHSRLSISSHAALDAHRGKRRYYQTIFLLRVNTLWSRVYLNSLNHRRIVPVKTQNGLNLFFSALRSFSSLTYVSPLSTRYSFCSHIASRFCLTDISGIFDSLGSTEWKGGNSC